MRTRKRKPSKMKKEKEYLKYEQSHVTIVLKGEEGNGKNKQTKIVRK